MPMEQKGKKGRDEETKKASRFVSALRFYRTTVSGWLAVPSSVWRRTV